MNAKSRKFSRRPSTRDNLAVKFMCNALKIYTAMPACRAAQVGFELADAFIAERDRTNKEVKS